MRNSNGGSPVSDALNATAFKSRSVAWFVALLTVVMALAMLVFVYQYAHSVPFFGDWFFIPALTGHVPITLQWLWSQHNDHRMPITKLLLLGLYRISGGDLRAGMYFSAAALIVMTFL